jgi:hypothetical protein
MICRSAPQLVFILEVIGNQRMVNTGAFCNVAGRCPLEAILGERLNRGVEELLLRDDTALLLFADRLL